MEITGLKMACFNTTKVGVLRGVLDHYGLNGTDAWAFGASGHAFAINIHETLCPSGPYCWDNGPFHRLVRNLGVAVEDCGFFSQQSGAEERRKVEAALVKELDQGVPCSLINMENQLITGCDDTGFLTAQPWAPHVDFPPRHLTFGTWEELGKEIHLDFFIWRRAEPAPAREAAAASLEYAVDMARNPGAHTREPYAAGLQAYPKWVAAVRAGHGSSHGNWWNGTVWAECRRMASAYLTEIGERFPAAAEMSNPLAAAYGAVAEMLGQASDKELDADRKVGLIEAAAQEEAAAVEGLPALADAVRQAA
ncbi:MAG: hypothetical protein ABIL09_22375 [Gemmatimonadota bacterium]